MPTPSIQSFGVGLPMHLAESPHYDGGGGGKDHLAKTSVFSPTSRSFTRHSRVDIESHKRRLSVPMRTACPSFAQSIDYADPSVAQRKQRFGGKIPSLAWINVVKRKELDFMIGIDRADLYAEARFLPFVWSEE